VDLLNQIRNVLIAHCKGEFKAHFGKIPQVIKAAKKAGQTVRPRTGNNQTGRDRLTLANLNSPDSPGVNFDYQVIENFLRLGGNRLYLFHYLMNSQEILLFDNHYNVIGESSTSLIILDYEAFSAEYSRVGITIEFESQKFFVLPYPMDKALEHCYRVSRDNKNSSNMLDKDRLQKIVSSSSIHFCNPQIIDSVYHNYAITNDPVTALHHKNAHVEFYLRQSLTSGIHKYRLGVISELINNGRALRPTMLLVNKKELSVISFNPTSEKWYIDCINNAL